MILGELITTFRRRVSDEVEPYLWSDDDVREFADDAENEAAERASLIRDSTTAAVCEIEVVSGTSSYTLDSRILRVERAKLDLGTVPLELSSMPAMDREGPGWELRTGRPSMALLDAEGVGWKLTLVPAPVEDDTLRLRVIRLPIGLLSADEGNEPEIPYRLHIRLVDWMVHRAYSKEDAETRDSVKAAEAEAVFTRAFGERIDANARRTQNDRAPGVMVFREF